MTTGLDVFGTTVHETNFWLKDVMERIGTDDRHSAYSTLRAVLHAPLWVITRPTFCLVAGARQ